jgi:sec-independent protein translocase protein TatA
MCLAGDSWNMLRPVRSVYRLILGAIREIRPDSLIRMTMGDEYKEETREIPENSQTERRLKSPQEEETSMYFTSPAEIFGVDGIIVLIVVVLVLFGSTQIPKLARSLGSAQKEFKKGIDDGASDDGASTKTILQIAPATDVKVPAQTTVVVESTAAESQDAAS